MAERRAWKEGLERLPKLSPAFKLEAEKMALLIIDMQYLDAHPDYGLGAYLKRRYPEAHAYYCSRLSQTVVPNHQKLLDFFRRNGLRVIYVTVGPALEDRSDLTPYMRVKTASGYKKTFLSPVGSFEHQFLEDIKPARGELIVNKTSAGAFNSTAIDHTLRNMGIQYLVVTGVVTFCCVEATARDAADRGYNTVLVDDACAGFDEAMHDAALREFAVCFGRVASTDEVCAELRESLGDKYVSNKLITAPCRKVVGQTPGASTTR